jgi:hypothetical protein
VVISPTADTERDEQLKTVPLCRLDWDLMTLGAKTLCFGRFMLGRPVLRVDLEMSQNSSPALGALCPIPSECDTEL